MSYTVHIRKNATGEVRVYHETYPWEDICEYMWTEGSFGCDCNRHLFFERAGGRQPELDEGTCGSTAYTVLKIELEDGSVIDDIDAERSANQPT